MAHKVHPIAFRIHDSSGWYSRGYYEKSFPKLLEEDFAIRAFLNKRLAGIGISEVEIERFPGKMNVVISCVRPGLIIGRQVEHIVARDRRHQPTGQALTVVLTLIVRQVLAFAAEHHVHNIRRQREFRTGAQIRHGRPGEVGIDLPAQA